MVLSRRFWTAPKSAREAVTVAMAASISSMAVAALAAESMPVVTVRAVESMSVLRSTEFPAPYSVTSPLASGAVQRKLKDTAPAASTARADGAS